MCQSLENRHTNWIKLIDILPNGWLVSVAYDNEQKLRNNPGMGFR